MRKRYAATLEAIFAHPVRAGVRWSDIEALIVALGGEIEERAGSRVAVILNGQVSVFHRPHPRPDTDKGALRKVREFLENAGVKP